MALLTVQEISRAGLVATAAAAAGGGDTFPNDGRTFLRVINGGGSSITVTITTTATLGGEAVADTAVAVANGVTRDIGPFPPAIYNNDSGQVAVGYSGVTTVTVAAIRLP